MSCSPDVSRPSQEKILWDTAFKVEAVAFPSDSIMTRAVVHPGNNYRLSKFFQKCSTTKEVKVGFIGGSITEGALAYGDGARYSSRLCEFLGKSFPGVNFKEVNAGIGATTSRFACSRVHDDLLAQKPDMIVIEFAVNDDINDSATSAATVEGLVRQSLQLADVPVVLFQTMNRIGDSINHSVQKKVARHYGLPVISYRNACWPLVASGKIPWTILSPDEVHPNNTGHLVCAYLLYSFLKSEIRLLGSGVDGQLGIPDVLVTDLYQFASMFQPGDSTLAVLENNGWSLAEDGRKRYNLVSQNKGDRLVIKTSAREMTLSFLFSKELNSQMRVSLDGVVLDTLSNYFAQDWGGGYLKPRQIFRNEDKREHAIEFTNLSGGKFDLRYLLYAR